jgi:putative transposase
VSKRFARKRHSEKEIGEKLALAEQMAQEGKTQAEISNVLGISVMTFHRWRKDFASSARGASRRVAARNGKNRIREIEAENARLREFVLRMVLENEGLRQRT